MNNILPTVLPSVVVGVLVVYAIWKIVQKSEQNTIAHLNYQSKTIGDSIVAELNREKELKRELAGLHDIPHIPDLLEHAVELTNRSGKISTSALQRKFRIGYSRAANLVDELIALNIVEETRSKNGSYKYIKGSSLPELKFLVGSNEDGNKVFLDFRKTPHALSAGETGSGQASFIEGAFVMSIIDSYPPDYVKFVMIDTKSVQLTQYTDLPHLLRPVITEVEGAKDAIQSLLDEMTSRFELFNNADVINIDQFNSKASVPLPYIILLIPEIADLGLTKYDKFFHDSFQKFTMMSRAVGIHMHLGTAQPTEEALPGVLDVSITGKIIFKVSNEEQSESLLYGQARADLLDKPGELYYKEDLKKPVKLLAPLVSRDDINSIVKKVVEKS